MLSGSLGGTVFIVDDSVDTVLIGSDASCRFALPGTDVDPIHARLWIDLEGITVYDADSARGVYINDDRVVGQARLRNGDILWLGAPGDDRSVMLQCRLPGGQPAAAAPRPAAAPPAAAPPPALPDDIEPTAAMMAIDLDPTVSLVPETDPAPEPTMALSLDDEPAEPTVVLAPDAIQPEPTVRMVKGDEFPEPEATVAMLLDEPGPVTVEPEPQREPEPEPEPTAAITALVDESPTVGWDASAGGIPAAADPPWMAGAPASATSPGEMPTIAEAPAVARVEHEPPPLPPKPPPLPPKAPPAAPRAASPEARTTRAPEPPPVPKPAPVAKPRRETAAAPAPRRETPPAVPAAPPRRREPARPPDDDAERMAPPPRRGAPMGLLIGGGLLAAAAVAAAGWWMLTRGPAAPGSGADAPPPTVAGARPATPPPAPADPVEARPAPAVEAPVEEEVTIVTAPPAGATPAPGPSRAPSLAPPPTQVAAAPPVTAAPAAPAAPPPAVVAAGLAGRAEAARQAGNLDAAADLFDQALRADPGNAAATSGKAAVAAARAAARKAFMPGRTVVQTQNAKADMAGFDTADVSVKKAPDFSGRIEFAVNPARVKPGDSYAVQIYLVNEGKKSIKVSGVSVTTNLNGAKSGRSVPSPVKEVQPAQRALLGELPGVWPDDVNWWSTEVMVTANKGDSLKNLLTWK